MKTWERKLLVLLAVLMASQIAESWCVYYRLNRMERESRGEPEPATRQYSVRMR